MPFPTNIAVLGEYVVIEQTGTANVSPKKADTKIGTVRQVGDFVTTVQAYNIVLFDVEDAKVFVQYNVSYSVVPETKILLITQYTP